MKMATLAHAPSVRRSGFKQILMAGLAGGAVDAAYFTAKALITGKPVLNTLHSISGFWSIGPRNAGEVPSALLGTATHFGLAAVMAGGYFLLRRKSRLPGGNDVVVGAAYGVFLYLIMYWVVLPLRWPLLFPRFDGFTSVLDLVVHMAVGITIALVEGHTRSRIPAIE